jgi:hypothetical protein
MRSDLDEDTRAGKKTDSITREKLQHAIVLGGQLSALHVRGLRFQPRSKEQFPFLSFRSVAKCKKLKKELSYFVRTRFGWPSLFWSRGNT